MTLSSKDLSLTANAFLLVYMYVNVSLFSRFRQRHFVCALTIKLISRRLHVNSVNSMGCYLLYLISHLHARLIVFIYHLAITSTCIDELVICSLNVRGLSNTLKGEKSFDG